MLEHHLLVEAVSELGVQRGSWGTEWGEAVAGAWLPRASI